MVGLGKKAVRLGEIPVGLGKGKTLWGGASWHTPFGENKECFQENGSL